MADQIQALICIECDTHHVSSTDSIDVSVLQREVVRVIASGEWRNCVSVISEDGNDIRHDIVSAELAKLLGGDTK